MNEKMYLVKYSTGSYEDYHQVVLFVTHSKDKADKYVEKFNRILNYWKDIVQSCEDENGYPVHTTSESLYDRYYDIIEMGHSFIEEVEVR
jgi:hypothetical protein